MNKIAALLAAFEQAVSEPWSHGLSIAERIWFLVYDPEDHRRLMAAIPEAEMATKRAGKQWKPVSLAALFQAWMAGHEYRDDYFESPEALADELASGFVPEAQQRLSANIAANNPDDGTLTVVFDAQALFGLARLSQVLDGIPRETPGRILILFPGIFEANHYRLLNARDGWNYLARPITA